MDVDVGLMLMRIGTLEMMVRRLDRRTRDIHAIAVFVGALQELIVMILMQDIDEKGKSFWMIIC